jgi:glycosyltransferase involved in cell wall biosynthesis
MSKVSVILLSFNHEKFIREAIDSVLAQTFKDFELIILDDASIDNSWAIINSYSDCRIKAFRADVLRGVFVVNKVITEVASGEYIAIHHSDDVWEPIKLEKQVDFLDSQPGYGSVFTNALIINEKGQPLDDESHQYYKIFDQPHRTRHEWLNHFFCRGNALCHPSVLIRKLCYQDCGLYRYGLAQVCDLDMWIRLCLKYEIYVLPEKLVRFRVLENEANSSGNRRDVRIRAATESFNLYKNFLRIQRFDEMVAIFPEAKSYYRKDGFDPKFVLAMVAIGDTSPHLAKLFGIELLFELLGDATTAKKIKSLYGFDYHDFVVLTAKHDVFLFEAVANLAQTVAERDGQIVNLNQAVTNLNQAVAERDAEIARLYSTISWRITKPIRVFKKFISAMQSVHEKS